MTERVLVFGKDKDTELIEPANVKPCSFGVGDDVRAIAVVPVYYNPDTLQYEWATKPSIQIDDLHVSMGDLEKLLADNYWKLKKFDYSTNLDYKGMNTDPTAADGDTDWYVWKYTWSGSNCTMIQGPAVGSWTGRASLF